MSSGAKFNISEKFLTYDLSNKLLNKFGTSIPVVICLGSDKVLSDMVGVFVADILREKGFEGKVFGGTDFPITTKNLNCLLHKISDKQVLYVDSCICATNGKVIFDPSGIILHNGLKLNGASIKAGTVKIKNGKMLLANTRYNFIKKLANMLSKAILDYAECVKLLKKY